MFSLIDYFTSIHQSPFYSGPRPQATKRIGITITLAGQQVAFQIPPFVLNGHTLCQIRPLAEAMGATVSWNQTAQMVTFTRGARTATCQVGSEVGVVGGEGHALEEPPMMIENSVVVPLRFVAEALGFMVEWNEPTSTITVIRRSA